ncbi:MAG: dienelactone hydrolase family protein, partial [Nitrososphaeraceae archaeon]
MKTNTIIMRKISLALLSLSLLIASVALPMNMANHRAIPDAYAQTNAAMLNALAANDINITSNAAASNITIANTTTSSSASNTTEGLQIKRDINYFDSSSGYLVYPSATTGKKLPAVIMIHENRGLNDNIKSMANTLAREGYVVLAVDLFKGQVAQASHE